MEGKEHTRLTVVRVWNCPSMQVTALITEANPASTVTVGWSCEKRTGDSNRVLSMIVATVVVFLWQGDGSIHVLTTRATGPQHPCHLPIIKPPKTSGSYLIPESLDIGRPVSCSLNPSRPALLGIVRISVDWKRKAAFTQTTYPRFRHEVHVGVTVGLNETPTPPGPCSAPAES